jgi:hypothetical protein
MNDNADMVPLTVGELFAFVTMEPDGHGGVTVSYPAEYEPDLFIVDGSPCVRRGSPAHRALLDALAGDAADEPLVVLTPPAAAR